MQLARVRHRSGESHVAAYVKGQVVDLQIAQQRVAGKPDPMFDSLATLLESGERDLERAETLAKQALSAGQGQPEDQITFLSPRIPQVFLGLGYNYRALATHEGLPFNKHPEMAEVIEYITARITLSPGDVISTGTSLGVGIIKKPPEFLKEGDVVEVQIEGYPALRNRVEWEKP